MTIATSSKNGSRKNKSRKKRPYLGYLAERTLRRISYRICRQLYRDDFPELQRSVFLAGTARSGTTWLGELIAAQQPTRMMFEPFHPQKVPDYGAYNYFQYMRPEEDDAALEAFCARVLTGQIRNPWIDRDIRVLRPQARIIKDVRANLLLKWLSRRFPDLPVVLLLRHPCAVVLSRMELGWATDQDIAPMLSQEKLVDDFLKDKIEFIAQARHDEEKHAVIWAIHNAVPLAQFADGGIHIIRYESLLSDTAACLHELMTSIGGAFDDRLSPQYAQPSNTSSLATALEGAAVANRRWEQRLSKAQIERIMGVVDAFGLGDLYSSSH